MRFDFFSAEWLHTTNFLLLSRNPFLGNKEYWTGLSANLDATAIRHEIAGLLTSIEKIVISDNLTGEALAPWNNTRIFKHEDAYSEIATLKQYPVSLKLFHTRAWEGSGNLLACYQVSPSKP